MTRYPRPRIGAGTDKRGMDWGLMTMLVIFGFIELGLVVWLVVTWPLEMLALAGFVVFCAGVARVLMRFAR